MDPKLPFIPLDTKDINDLKTAFKEGATLVQVSPEAAKFVGPSPLMGVSRGTKLAGFQGPIERFPVVDFDDKPGWSVPAEFIPFRLTPIFKNKNGEYFRQTSEMDRSSKPELKAKKRGRAESKLSQDLQQGTQEFLWDAQRFPAWGKCLDPIAVRGEPNKIEVEYALFPLSYTPYSHIRNEKTGPQSELKFIPVPSDPKQPGLAHFRYLSPSLGEYEGDSQDSNAVFKPDRLAETAFYQAVAYMMFLGIPIVFETSDAGQHPDVFIRTFVRHLVGVYRTYPSFIELIQKEQLTLLLKIDNFSPSRLHELTKHWRDEMVQFCMERELEVHYFQFFDEHFEKFIKKLRFERGERTIAETAIPGCDPKGFIDLGSDEALWPYKSIEFLEHAAHIFKMPAFLGDWQSRIVTFVDVGQVNSTMAIASQVSGVLFPDGAPGSVKIQNFNTVPSSPDKGITGIVLKTRNPNSVMANALVFAVAFKISSIIIIPAALPIEQLIRPIKIAIQRGGELLLSPGETKYLESFETKKVVLVSREGTRDLEGIAAVELLKVVLTELGVISYSKASSKSRAKSSSKSKSGGGKQSTGNIFENVIHTSDLHEVFLKILDAPAIINSKDPKCLTMAQLFASLVAFGVVNDYAEYLELDDE